MFHRKVGNPNRCHPFASFPIAATSWLSCCIGCKSGKFTTVAVVLLKGHMTLHDLPEKKHTRLLQPNTKELYLLDLSSFSSNARALDLLWKSSTCFLLFFSFFLLLLFLPPPPCTLVSTACQHFVSLITIPMTIPRFISFNINFSEF